MFWWPLGQCSIAVFALCCPPLLDSTPPPLLPPPPRSPAAGGTLHSCPIPRTAAEPLLLSSPLPLAPPQLGERFIAVLSLVLRRNPKAVLGALNRHMVTGQDEDPGDAW